MTYVFYLEAGQVLEILVDVSRTVARIVVVTNDHTLLRINSALTYYGLRGRQQAK